MMMEKPLKDLNNDEFEYLEVAHIIPHSLTSISPENSQLVRPSPGNRKLLLFSNIVH